MLVEMGGLSLIWCVALVEFCRVMCFTELCRWKILLIFYHEMLLGRCQQGFVEVRHISWSVLSSWTV